MIYHSNSWSVVRLYETYLVELNHVWVTDLLENFDLPCDSFNVLLIVDLLFLQNFDSDLQITKANESFHNGTQDCVN